MYKRQVLDKKIYHRGLLETIREIDRTIAALDFLNDPSAYCLLYTSDAADERSSVDLGGRRIIKKKKEEISRRDITMYRD